MRSWPITSMRVVGVVVVFFVRDVLGGYFHGDLARLLAGCAWVLGICAHVHTYLVPAQALPGHFQHQTRPGAGARDWRSSRCRAASSGNPGPRRLYRSPRTLCAPGDRKPGPLPPQGGGTYLLMTSSANALKQPAIPTTPVGALLPASNFTTGFSKRLLPSAAPPGARGVPKTHFLYVSCIAGTFPLPKTRPYSRGGAGSLCCRRPARAGS